MIIKRIQKSSFFKLKQKMKISLISLAVVVIAVLLSDKVALGQSTPAPGDADGSSCFTDLTDIFDIEFSGNTSVAEVRTYILCPDTEFDVGFSNPNINGPDDPLFIQGSYPIVPRPRAHYKCGTDGRSSNNCIIQGGEAAISAQGGGNLVDVVFEGITFRQNFIFTAFFNRPGSFLFTDCVFKVRLSATFCECTALSSLAISCLPPAKVSRKVCLYCTFVSLIGTREPCCRLVGLAIGCSPRP